MSSSVSVPKNKYILSSYEIVRCYVSLFVASSGVVASIYPVFLMPSIYCISTYVFLDLYFAKKDMRLHHLLTLSYFVAMCVHNYREAFIVHFMFQVIKFEYSTIVYSGGPLVLHYLSSKQESVVVKWVPFVRNLCQISFAILFVKYRIYEFSSNIVFCKETYEPRNYQTSIAYIHLIATTLLFYGLNIYWLQLIIWKLIPTTKNTNKMFKTKEE